MPDTDFTVVAMEPSHVEAVVQLDRISCAYYDDDLECIAIHSLAPTREALAEFLATEGTAGLVLLEGERKVVGYVLWACGPKAFHVVGLVVRPEYRRKWLGRGLLKKVLSRAANSLARGAVVAHVHERDHTSIAFYKAQGFRSRLVRGYFRCGLDVADDQGLDRREDAVRFTKVVRRKSA